MDAELVTFHADGSLRRVFPLNGKLSGYWTEADEGALAKAMELSTPLGEAMNPQGGESEQLSGESIALHLGGVVEHRQVELKGLGVHRLHQRAELPLCAVADEGGDEK